jgi:alkylated DNA repair dioxygenase AlkB
MQEQGTLFSSLATERTSEVPGLFLRNDFISMAEEQELLACVEDGPWQSDWRRRIQQYGLGYSSSGGKPAWVRDFPPWLLPLACRVAQDANFERFPENCVVNEYIPPLGIAPHRDYPAFGATIACVSLGSDIILDFIKSDRSARVPIFVPARSLWVISGPARSEWLHGIAPRFNDIVAGERRPRQRRISITFRTARNAALVPGHHGKLDFQSFV